MSHVIITTESSFRAGIDLPPETCPICNINTYYASWVSWHCDTCGFDNEHYLPYNIRIIRENTGLSRKQIALKLGYSKNTVKNYELNKTSKVYFKKFKKFIFNFYKKKELLK